MHVYDYIVIGGGLSGLYSALALSGIAGAKVLVIEQSPRLGGRIHTIHTPANHIEMGAGRIADSHHHMRRLVKYLGLGLTPARPTIRYAITNTIKDMRPMDEHSGFYQTVERLVSRQSDPLARSRTVYGYVRELDGVDCADQLVWEFGHDDDLLYQNARMGMDMFKRDFARTTKYHGVVGGFDRVIDAIRAKLKGMGHMVDVIHGTVVEVTKQHGVYGCVAGESVYMARNLIVTTTLQDMRKIKMFQPIDHIYEPVLRTKSLVRIYMVFPPYHTKNGTHISKPWFDDLNGMIVSRTLVRQIIPIDKSTGLVMVAYADGSHAVNLEGCGAVDVVHALRHIFVDRHIPDPVKVYKKYWHDATHIWTQYVDRSDMRRLMRPIATESIYYVGEAISPIHGWTEGAIWSVNFFMKMYMGHLEVVTKGNRDHI